MCFEETIGLMSCRLIVSDLQEEHPYLTAKQSLELVLRVQAFWDSDTDCECQAAKPGNCQGVIAGGTNNSFRDELKY